VRSGGEHPLGERDVGRFPFEDGDDPGHDAILTRAGCGRALGAPIAPDRPAKGGIIGR
jgi:hypothetical protein